MHKTLLIRYEVEYDPMDPANEADVLRYCHELAEDAALVPDFVQAEIDGQVLTDFQKNSQ